MFRGLDLKKQFKPVMKGKSLLHNDGGETGKC